MASAKHAVKTGKLAGPRQRTTIEIDVEILTVTKAQAVRERCSVADLIEKALQEYLHNR